MNQNHITSRFKCPLHEFDFSFFSRLNIHPSDSYLALLLPVSSSLYKEQLFPEIAQKGLKKSLPSYIHSLFPLENLEKKSEVTVKKILKQIHVTVCITSQNAIDLSQSLLSQLDLVGDYLGIWQSAFINAVTPHILSHDGLFFYFSDQHLFIIYLESKMCLFSSVISLAHLESLEDALKDLQLKYTGKNTWVIGSNHSKIDLLKNHFPDFQTNPFFEDIAEYFLIYGNALQALKNEGNFQQNKSLLFLKSAPIQRLLKRTAMINFCASFIIFTSAILGYFYHQNQLNLPVFDSLASKKPLLVTRSDVNTKKLELQKIINYSKFVPEAPSPCDVLSFLSSHKAFSDQNITNGKLGSISDFSYQLIDLFQASVFMKCSFPTKEHKQVFENDLRIKKITFKATEQGHLYFYELLFTKNNLQR